MKNFFIISENAADIGSKGDIIRNAGYNIIHTDKSKLSSTLCHFDMDAAMVVAENVDELIHLLSDMCSGPVFALLPSHMMGGKGVTLDGVVYDDESDEIFAMHLQNAMQKSCAPNSQEIFLQAYEPIYMLGHSSSLQQFTAQIERTAPTRSRVMLLGDFGAGKAFAAYRMHMLSAGKDGAFITIGADSTIAKSANMLVGEVDSSVGDIPRVVTGALQMANGGTLFISELTALPISIQQSLNTILQQGHFTPIGCDEGDERCRRSLNTRIITATSASVPEAVANGLIDGDLYHRLSVVPIHVPRLKERREDIPALCAALTSHTARELCVTQLTFSQDAMAALQAYDWPGNMLELINVVRMSLISQANQDIGHTSPIITSDMLPGAIFDRTPATVTPGFNTDIMSMSLKQAREVFEREYLTAQINRFGGNISRTSAFIGMERSALHRKLKMLGVHHHVNDEKISA